MEENELFQQPEASVFDVTISPSVAYSLRETCRWAALFAYIAGGLLLLIALCFAVGWGAYLRLPLFSADYGSGYALGFTIAWVVIFGLAIGFLTLLVLFSRRVKSGLATRNLQMVEDGVGSLKYYFTISGIFGILALALTVFNLIVYMLA